MAVEFNSVLFQELVLYLAKRSADDPDFGKTKLAKLLAFIDFASFERYGEPLTGATYIKLEFGPAPTQLPDALTHLSEAGRLHLAPEDRFGYTQSSVYADDEPRLRLPPPAQELVDEVLERFEGWNNSEISELAHHQFVGWQLVNERDPIPYRSLYLSPLAPTRDEIRYGRELAETIKRERGL